MPKKQTMDDWITIAGSNMLFVLLQPSIADSRKQQALWWNCHQQIGVSCCIMLIASSNAHQHNLNVFTSRRYQLAHPSLAQQKENPCVGWRTRLSQNVRFFRLLLWIITNLIVTAVMFGIWFFKFDPPFTALWEHKRLSISLGALFYLQCFQDSSGLSNV